MGFPGGTVVKNLLANAENSRDTGSIPGLRRSPGVGNGNPLQYSGLEKSHGQRHTVGYEIFFQVVQEFSAKNITLFPTSSLLSTPSLGLADSSTHFRYESRCPFLLGNLP